MRRGTAALSLGLTLVALVALARAAPIRVKMGELHAEGGVPPGWKFRLPAGDPAKGKEVFTQLECYSCHVVEGQGFPPKATDQTGPQLTGMGAHHPAEYLAESILDPNAVILIDVSEWVGPDGLSKMPSYNDSLTVAQWVDLVAYLKSLTGAGAGHHAGHGGHDMHGMAMGPERDKTVGAYRVHVEYAEPRQARQPGHLAVAVTDVDSGQPVPYLPVRARIVSDAATHTVTLRPRLGPRGVEYDASVMVPDETQELVVLIGPATVSVSAEARDRYRTPREVSFEW
jgi:mono/diheme cytochrome c family protein